MINIEEVEDVYYKHGNVTDINFGIKQYVAIDIIYANGKAEQKLIMSGELCSLLIVNYDREFKEHFEVLRGRITAVTYRSIRTRELFKPKSNDIIVSIDCSTDHSSDIRRISADHILDKFEIDHEYEIMNPIPLKKEDTPDDYTVEEDTGLVDVPLTDETIIEE